MIEQSISLPHTEVGVRYTHIIGVESQAPQELQSSIDQSLRIGKVRVNGLKQAIRSDGTEYGMQYDKQLEDPRADHHNRFHQRHVDKFGRAALQAFIEAYPYYEPSFTSEEALADISAFAMFPVLHDNTQLDFVAHNMDLLEDEKLQEKKGHGVGAAIQTLVFTRKYAEVNNIPLEEAWKITTAAAIMELRHDFPKKFDRTFSPVKVYSGEAVRYLQGKVILKAFENDEIRLYDLSPAQLIDIFKQSRGVEKGYGFVASFEKDYAQELSELAASNEPIIPDITPEREERLKQLTEIAYWADMADMVSPYTEQLTRTLNTQYSKNRSFSAFYIGSNMTIDAAMMQIESPEGKLISDDMRLLWEMVHVNGISENSIFKDIPWVKDFLKEHIIMGGLVLREMGVRVMRGDYSVVEAIYNNRLAELNKRIFALEAANPNEKVNGGITRKMQGIMDERDHLILSLQQKHEDYSPQDAKNFQILVDRVVAKLAAMYHLSEEDLNDYQIKANDFMKANTLTFESDPVVQNPLTVTTDAYHYLKTSLKVTE